MKKQRRLSIKLLTFLAFVGLGLSIILTAEHFRLNSGTLGGVKFCGDGCESALRSEDAYIAGIPAAVLGLGWYAGLVTLCLCALLTPANRDGWPSAPWTQGVAALGLLALPGAGWFSFKMFAAAGHLPAFQTFERYDLCPYCLATHTTTLLFALTALVASIMSGSGGEAEDDIEGAEGPANVVFRMALVAGVSVGLLAYAHPTLWAARDKIARNEETVDKLRAIPGVSEMLGVAQVAGVSEEAMNAALEDPRPPTYGDLEARVVLRAFVDLGCPHCVSVTTTLKKEVDNARGKVRMEMIHFPSSHQCNPHSRARTGSSSSCQAAIASLAAYQLGGDEKFWEFFAILRDRELDLARDPWSRWARRLELDPKEFETAMNSEETRTHLDRDIFLGSKVPVEIWPTVLLDDQTLKADVRPQDVTRLIYKQIAERYPLGEDAATAAETPETSEAPEPSATDAEEAAEDANPESADDAESSE